MRTIDNAIEDLNKLISNPEGEEMTLNNCHVHGMISYVFGVSKVNRQFDGGAFLTRAFIASDIINPYDIQMHTHKYNLTIIPLTSGVRNISAKKKRKHSTLFLDEYIYKEGKFKYKDVTNLEIKDIPLQVGVPFIMKSTDIHTIYTTEGNTCWVVIESPRSSKEEVGSSRFYGIPFKTEGLYTKPKENEITAARDKVSELIKLQLHKTKL